ncbi:MAG: oligoribonuclease [Candidatus Azotimanducaceae bacterium]|uniref:Oligoribonuclease n=1 Tax=OM182 bacterium TaxID=2510334 RepID=A0A520S2P7_9GAMM|nr:oligoribonuclease [Gammaproteobacteria bacterium]OUV68628.1 MAG: oligoribonuclease [Gammaproteobacteria bacterium TMED133]RZO76734.1 MAG: oligoribonuclease [OM182 bacterium]
MVSFSKNLVWMDLEMTGLNPDLERILEIATIITDSQLNIIAEGPVIAVRQSEKLISGMDDWNTEHHTRSGLVDRVLNNGISEAEAQARTISFISDYVSKGKSPLCGNSIGQDRRFLVRYMPELENFLHYRNIDVSTVKELALRWRPDLAEGVTKDETHRALDDIKESIDELRYYKEMFFLLS